MTFWVFGVDPGLNGAIVAIRGNAFAGAWRLPPALPDQRDLLAQVVWDHGDGVWFVERQQPMPRQGRSAIARQMMAVGWLHGLLVAMRQEWHEIAPMAWQRACNVPRGHGKSGALSVAARRWPELMAAMQGWRMPQKEGGCDAALIALGGMRMRGIVRQDNKSARAS
jgi:hypothetical protein